MTRLVVLEGPDGSGKSSLTDALADALGARAFHHPRPPEDSDPWEAALHYAAARSAESIRCRMESVPLLLCDRGAWSTIVLAHVMGDPGRSIMVSLAQGEMDRWRPALTLLCDADDDVLDARLTARGEWITEGVRAARLEYRRLARLRGWPVLDTTRDRDVVLEQALACVRGVL